MSNLTRGAWHLSFPVSDDGRFCFVRVFDGSWSSADVFSGALMIALVFYMFDARYPE